MKNFEKQNFKIRKYIEYLCLFGFCKMRNVQTDRVTRIIQTNQAQITKLNYKNKNVIKLKKK